jgi:hypothetical protein
VDATERIPLRPTDAGFSPLADETIDANVEYRFERSDLAPEGIAFLMPYQTRVKSLVWYRPDVFEEHDWAIPDTLAGLHELVDEIAGSDVAPWCLTIESGSSTGWAASDWIEDLMLRRAGPDTYEQWMLGALPFTDESVREAVAEFDDLVLARSRGCRRCRVRTSVSTLTPTPPAPTIAQANDDGTDDERHEGEDTCLTTQTTATSCTNSAHRPATSTTPPSADSDVRTTSPSSNGSRPSW